MHSERVAAALSYFMTLSPEDKILLEMWDFDEPSAGLSAKAKTDEKPL